MQSRSPRAAVALLWAAVGLAGCAGGMPSFGDASAAGAAAAGRSASATIAPLGGSSVNGRVTFTQVGPKVRVRAQVQGLTPGLHGFHIHERGECVADGTSAGGHFNPHGSQHGPASGARRHGGDMGNLNADAQGRATLELELEDVSVGGSIGDIIGRSVIVHADPDDLTSQPTGNSGRRVGCALIVAG